MDLKADDDYYEYVHLFPKYKTKFDEVMGENNHVIDLSNCQSSAKESFKDHEDYKKQCPKIAKYLTHLNNSEDGDNFKRCRFLNYLLNSEKIYNKIGSHSKSDIIEAYNELTRSKHRCIGNIEPIRDDILSHLQILYNLYDAYRNIKFESNSDVKESCEYARKCTQYYGENINKCRENSKHKFCQQLIDFQKEYNEHMKYDTNCSDVSNYLPNIEIDYISPIILTSVIVLLTLAIAFIFLKFTPIGSCIVNKRIMKKTIIDDINKKNLKLSHISKYVENDLSKKKYNIQYNTT